MCDRFLERSVAALEDFDEDELEAEEGECGACGEGQSPSDCQLSFTLIPVQYFSETTAE